MRANHRASYIRFDIKIYAHYTIYYTVFTWNLVQHIFFDCVYSPDNILYYASEQVEKKKHTHTFLWFALWLSSSYYGCVFFHFSLFACPWYMNGIFRTFRNTLCARPIRRKFDQFNEWNLSFVRCCLKYIRPYEKGHIGFVCERMNFLINLYYFIYTKLNATRAFGFENPLLHFAVNFIQKSCQKFGDDEHTHIHKRKMIIIIEKYVKAQIEHFQK